MSADLIPADRDGPDPGTSGSRVGAASAALLSLAGLFFLLLCYLPLRATDLWVHVTWGDWILDHRALPAEDPVMSLAAGVKVVDGEWLSQVAFALVERALGPEGLSAMFALTMLAIYLVLGRTYWLQSGGRGIALAGALLALGIGFSRLTTVRPENLGVLCFALLLWLLTSSGAWRQAGEPLRSPRLWLGVPATFALWANLHGSFPAGLAILGCLWAGRVVDVAWRTRSLSGVLGDRPMRRWLVLGELAFAATLVNPYTIDLHLHTLLFTANENLKDIIEWWPLSFTAWGGREFVVSWVLLFVVMRHSRRRVAAAEVLLLAVFSYAVMRGNRFIGFYAPVFVWVVTPHLAGLARRLRGAGGRRLWPRLAIPGLTPRVWLAFHLLLLWAVFALSPLSRPLLGGSARTAEQLHGDMSPVALAAHLRETPPHGLVFAPQAWADFLAWAGPPGLQPMVTSMIHLVPHYVWRDYMGVHNHVAGWPRAMVKYGIDTVVLSRDDHAPQAAMLRRSAEWSPDYEDRLGFVFRRVRPETAGADAGDRDAGEGPPP